MNSVLKALYDGKIFPAEQYWPKSEEYKKIQQEHYKHYDDFSKTLKRLDPSLDKQFFDIMDEQLDVLPSEFSEMFIDGFCLGARLMIEIFHQNPCSMTENL